MLTIGLWFGALGVAHAQAPSPADVGISKGAPNVFKLLDSSKTWTPFGSVDPTTHIFMPATNGTIAPNDCVKWGPGLTSAGAACNSVTGGAHPANQLTIYTSHSALVNNVTTPTEAWTVQQQGFYAPGDGGDVAYQWNFTSYCPGGASGAPATADGVICVLPIGQPATTAGRYLLSVRGNLDVRVVGMRPGGQDNSPYLATLLLASSSTPSGNSPATPNAGNPVYFTPMPGQSNTEYYFTQSLDWSRSAKIICGSVGGPAPVSLVFAAGVDGVIQDNGYMSSDGGWSSGTDLEGCNVISLGFGTVNLTSGSTAATSVVNSGVGAIPATAWTVGDGIMAAPYGYVDGMNTQLSAAGTFFSVRYGAYVTAVAGGALTLNAPASFNTPPVANRKMWAYRLPAALAYHVNTTVGSNIVTMVSGPPIKLWPGDMLWSDAFPFGATIAHVSGAAGAQTLEMYSVEYNQVLNASVTHTGGSGLVWNIPAGLKRRVQGQSHQDSIYWWPIDLMMSGSPGTTPPNGGTTNWDENDTLASALIGRFSAGSEVGASTSYANLYGGNHIADIVELSTIGNLYLGDNANSSESGSAGWSVIGGCVIGSPVFVGMYLTISATTPYCMSDDNSGGITPPPIPWTVGRGPMFLNSMDGDPPDANSYLAGAFRGSRFTTTGPISYSAPASTATPSGSVVNVPTEPWLYAGVGITEQQAHVNGSVGNAGHTGAGNILDVSNVISGSIAVGQFITGIAIPSGTTVVSGSGSRWTLSASADVNNVPFYFGVIPPNTTVLSFNGGTATISNPVVSPGIKVGDIVVYAALFGGPCAGIGGGLQQSLGLFFSLDCGTSLATVYTYFGGGVNLWSWGNSGAIGQPLLGVSNYDYLGYFPNPAAIAPWGIELSNPNDWIAGAERMLDMGSGPPTASTRRRGDVRFNSAAVVGSPLGWVDTADGANFVPFGVVGGFNGSKTAGACTFTIVNGAITNVTGC